MVDELHARSLLVAADAVIGSAPRLRLYDSVRRHALAGLDRDGHAADARRRHLAWLLHRLDGLVETAMFEPALLWLTPLQADVDSLRAALGHGLADDAPPEVAAMAVMLVAHSVTFWVRGGRRAEGARWLRRARVRAPSCGLTPLQQAQLQHAQAQFVCYAFIGDVPAALDGLDAALPVLQAAGLRAWVCGVHYIAATLMLRIGRPFDRLALLQALEAAYDPAWPLLAERYRLMMRCQLRGDRAALLDYVAAAEPYLARIDQPRTEFEYMGPASMLAQVQVLLGQPDAACARYAGLVDRLRRSGRLRTQTQTVALGAAVALWCRLDDDSLARALEAARLLLADDELWWMADGLPWAAWHAGRPEDAARLLAWADGLLAARGEQRGPVPARMRAALVTALQARLGQAGLAALATGAPADQAQALVLAFGADAVQAWRPAPAA